MPDRRRAHEIGRLDLNDPEVKKAGDQLRESIRRAQSTSDRLKKVSGAAAESVKKKLEKDEAEVEAAEQKIRDLTAKNFYVRREDRAGEHAFKKETTRYRRKRK